MSSTKIKDLPTSTGVLSSDNLIVSSNDLTYKLSLTDTKQEFRKQSVNNRTSSAESSYSILSSDLGAIINVNKIAHTRVTIPTNVSNAANIGDYIDIVNMSATNDVRLTPGSGIYLRSAGGHTDLTEQYAVGRATKLNSTDWILTGDFFTSPSGTF